MLADSDDDGTADENDEKISSSTSRRTRRTFIVPLRTAYIYMGSECRYLPRYCILLAWACKPAASRIRFRLAGDVVLQLAGGRCFVGRGPPFLSARKGTFLIIPNEWVSTIVFEWSAHFVIKC